MRRATSLILLFVFFLPLAPTASSQVLSARRALERQDYDGALEFLAEALERKPENTEALTLKGNVYLEKAFATEDVDEHGALIANMMECFSKSLEIRPKGEKQIGPRITLAYLNEFQRAIEAYNRGQSENDNNQFIAAASYFGFASLIMPDSTGPYINRAFALLNAGKDKEAIEPLEMGIEKGDSSVDSYTYLGNLYLLHDRAADAVVLLESAIEKHPENSELRAQLLNAYQLSGQGDAAMKSYADAVEREPDNKVFRYNYGSLLLESERYEEAIEQLKAAIALDENYGNAHYNLGAAYVNQAVAVNDKISDMDDELREKKGSMSKEEIETREGEIAVLADQRRELFELAIEPLVKARALLEADGEDVSGVCQVLFQSYVQTNQMDQAETVQACAGYDLE